MENDKDDVAWDKVRLEKIQFFHHLGEERLRAQLTVALAADQRASSAFNVCITLGLAVCGGIYALKTSNADWKIIFSTSLTAACLFLASLTFLWSARPQGFHVSGNIPSNWYSNYLEDPLCDVLGNEVQDQSQSILDNNEILKLNAKRYKYGCLLAIFSPVAGVGVFLLLEVTCFLLWGLTGSAAELIW